MLAYGNRPAGALSGVQAPFAFQSFRVAFPLAERTGTLPQVRGVWAGRVRLWDFARNAR